MYEGDRISVEYAFFSGAHSRNVAINAGCAVFPTASILRDGCFDGPPEILYRRYIVHLTLLCKKKNDLGPRTKGGSEGGAIWRRLLFESASSLGPYRIKNTPRTRFLSVYRMIKEAKYNWRATEPQQQHMVQLRYDT